MYEIEAIFSWWLSVVNKKRNVIKRRALKRHFRNNVFVTL